VAKYSLAGTLVNLTSGVPGFLSSLQENSGDTTINLGKIFSKSFLNFVLSNALSFDSVVSDTHKGNPHNY